MLRLSRQLINLAVAFLCATVTTVLAEDISFPTRDGTRPATTQGVPHVQLGVEPVPELVERMLSRVAEFPGVSLGPTRVSLPGAVGFQLDDDVALAKPNAIVSGREFAHVHPDGSLHASLDPEIARAAVHAGWATPHPWADQRPNLEGFVMIYTPLSDAELDVVLRLLKNAYLFVTGRPVP